MDRNPQKAIEELHRVHLWTAQFRKIVKDTKPLNGPVLLRTSTGNPDRSADAGEIEQKIGSAMTEAFWASSDVSLANWLHDQLGLTQLMIHARRNLAKPPDGQKRTPRRVAVASRSEVRSNTFQPGETRSFKIAGSDVSIIINSASGEMWDISGSPSNLQYSYVENLEMSFMSHALPLNKNYSVNGLIIWFDGQTIKITNNSTKKLKFSTMKGVKDIAGDIEAEIEAPHPAEQVKGNGENFQAEETRFFKITNPSELGILITSPNSEESWDVKYGAYGKPSTDLYFDYMENPEHT